MTIPAVREQIDRDFWLEGFRDFLALEAGHSANTVEAYLRDLRRMGEFALSRGVRDPARVGRPLLRDFVYLLKDLGLSAATIRR
ncbi:MAG TPA: site-specific integrase, partial [Gemmatimonadaceae bacterium]|nr:site-specific integrase [Gemmatimonadaceae bacterium]